MRMNDLPQGEKYIKSHRFHKRWHKVLMFLSSIVAFCTVYALILPAITMERECQLPEHTHTDACYTQVSSVQKMVPVCTPEALEIHQHTADCYDADGEPVCGYADFVVHIHDSRCYDENGALWCPLPEIGTHEHTDACYVQVGSELICGHDETDGSEGHTHNESCYGEDGELQCSLPESEAVEEHHHTDDCYGEEYSELACGRAEIVLHRHTAACRDENGSLICGRTQVLRHQHEDSCFTEETAAVDTDVLTCTSTDTDHVHTPRCYGTWVLTCGLEEHTHTDACYTSANAAESESASDSAEGTLKVSLLYGDQEPQSSHPEGVSYYTHTNMSGYLKLEPSGAETDLTDVTVTLTIPKQYVEKDSINIPDFNTNSSSTVYEILPVEEDDENYYARIHFTTYDKTQTLVLPFVLSFRNDVVPDTYALPVTASASGGNATEPNIYKPEYKPWEITKFVNSNRHREFSEDGAEVVVTPLEEGGNPYLDDLTYVDFAFTVNGCTYEGSNLSDWRDACEVTLTDQLPEYTDKDGVKQIAVFDADKNPGWTLSADGTSVSKTYQGTKSGDVLTQIYNDKLSLRLPGLKFEEIQNDLIAELDNSVHLTAVPSNAAEGETHPEADDSLRFRLTSDPSTSGRFSKWAAKGDIYDEDSYKTNPYPWRVSLHNDQKKTTPLRHIVIQDRLIAENGETVLKGLDEALKFVRLESNRAYSTLGDGQSYADIIDRVVAYCTDGTTQAYTITQQDLDASGNFKIVFDESKVCSGYDIIFRDDYAMQHGEGVEFQVYTVYRDPENTHVPEEAAKVTYVNEARSVNSYQNGDDTVFVYLKQAGSYDMLPSMEELRVSKVTLVNDGSSTWDGIGGNTVGSTYAYVIGLHGSLLEPEVKAYKDIRVVDLLPEGVHYEKIHLVQQDFSVGSILDGGKNYQPEIIENYHNSGRTAVIFHLNVENLRKTVKTQADIYFGVTIDQDAHPGKVRNYAYVVGDNLNEYNGSDLQKSGGTEDIYDLNNNGKTDDRIAYAFDDATIIASQSIYAEKFIAPAGSDSWSKQGLLVKTGADFDYLLRITNETKAKYSGLLVYDTLPRRGDRNIFGTQGRNSEFDIHLREAISPPEGYSVYYTTSTAVYEKPMEDMVNADIWTDSVSDYSSVTAFKIVAYDGTVLNGESTFEARIPAQAPSQLSDASMSKLHEKAGHDQATGTAAWLEAFNSFGFTAAESPSVKESNTVWARIPFAGFCVKKVDGTSGNAVSGAEFTLTDAVGKVIATAASGEDGLFSFRDLTEGTYTLTETKVPDGYMDRQLSVTVTITQNPVTMEYNISFGNLYPGVGSTADPLRLPNYTTPVLPATGGAGTNLYTTGGALLTAAAAYLLYIQNKRRKGGADIRLKRKICSRTENHSEKERNRNNEAIEETCQSPAGLGHSICHDERYGFCRRNKHDHR